MKRLTLIALLLVVSLLCTGLSVCADAAEPTSWIFVHDCDSTEGWSATGGTVTLDADNATEGEGCVSCKVDIPAGLSSFALEGTFSIPTDLTRADVIEFSLYLSDAYLATATLQPMIEIGSATDGTRETKRWMLDTSKETFVQGWNKITLPLGEAEDNGFRPGRMQYFRVYFFGINLAAEMKDTVVCIDDIRAYTYPQKLCLLYGCDSLDHWDNWGDNLKLDTADKTEGSASISNYTNSQTGGNLVYSVQLDPVDISMASYLEMDIYISDTYNFTHSKYGLDLEITSSGRCDEQEYFWEIGNYAVSNGWNHIRLPFESAGISGNNIDLHAVNYMRLHILECEKELTVKIDNICYNAPDIPEYMQWVTPLYDPDPTPTPTGEVQPTDTPTPTPIPTDDPSQDDPAEDTTEGELRARTTARRAKILVIIGVIAIVCADTIAVALHRKHKAEKESEEES